MKPDLSKIQRQIILILSPEINLEANSNNTGNPLINEKHYSFCIFIKLVRCLVSSFLKLATTPSRNWHSFKTYLFNYMNILFTVHGIQKVLFPTF